MAEPTPASVSTRAVQEVLAYLSRGHPELSWTRGVWRRSPKVRVCLEWGREEESEGNRVSEIFKTDTRLFRFFIVTPCLKTHSGPRSRHSRASEPRVFWCPIRASLLVGTETYDA
jgi:hypothetical protein